MKTNDRPPLKLPALRRIQFLKRRNEAACKEIRSLEDKANEEHGLNGLRAIGKNRARFEVSKTNLLCIEGRLVSPDSKEYDLAKAFGIEHYHGANNFHYDGMQVHLTANDGHLDLFIGYPSKPTVAGAPYQSIEQAGTLMLPENMKKVHGLLHRFGILVSVEGLRNKRNLLLKEAKLLDAIMRHVRTLND